MGGAARGEGEIAPDRPDLTNGTKTVAPGVLQIETGLQYARTRVGGGESERRLGLQLALRTGLTDTLEAQIAGEPLVRLRGAADDTGSGDLVLALKYRFLEARGGWPALGIQPSVRVPVAGAPIGTERPDFTLLALASFDLPARFDLDVNAGVAAVGQTRPGGYLLQGLASASLSREIVSGLSAFTELVFASRAERDARNAVGLNAGIIYLVTKDLAFDGAMGTSLAGPGPDYAVTAGLSVRFGR